MTSYMYKIWEQCENALLEQKFKVIVSNFFF